MGNLDPKSIPTDPKILTELLLAALEELQEKDRTIETQKAWIAELRTRLFGRKSESLSNENQRLLDLAIEGALARKPEPRPEPPPASPAPEPKGHGRARIPASL